MIQRTYKITALALSGVFFPLITQAQTMSEDIHDLHTVLDKIYEDMFPLCERLIGVGQGIAGFAALWYIASRVWRSIANAEPIDFYPLLRPFALGLCIVLFPSLIKLMNGVLQPTVTGTAAMMEDSNKAIEYLLKYKEEAIQKTDTYQVLGDEVTYEKFSKYINPDGETDEDDLLSSGIKFLMAKTAYGIKNQIKLWLSEILHVVYEAAALCINTLRTFYLIVLAILGPLVFGISVFDGLQNTLTAWIARYINVFLWLPVANIFGSIIAKIQENMLRIDIQQVITYGDTFFSSSDTGYIIFLIIGIIGYFTVPSVAGYIVHAGGSNLLLFKSTNLFAGAAATSASVFSGAATSVAGGLTSNSAIAAKSSASAGKSGDGSQDFMRNKLSGNKS